MLSSIFFLYHHFDKQLPSRYIPGHWMLISMLLMRMTTLIVVVFLVSGLWCVGKKLVSPWKVLLMGIILLMGVLFNYSNWHSLSSKCSISGTLSSYQISFLAGALLLEEVISSCGSEGIEAIIDSAKRRISESQQGKDSGSPGWWRVS